MIYAKGRVSIIQAKHILVQRQYSEQLLSLIYLTEKEIENVIKIEYSFKAFLPMDYSCYSLEDYTGKIKPYIEQKTKYRVTAVQVGDLQYVSEKGVKELKKK